MKKIVKCQFGYINQKRTHELIKTILGLAIIAIIFIAGIIIYGSKNNTLTILASVSALPFAKTASNFIIFLKYKSASKELFNKVEQHNQNCIANYDCIFTSKEKVMPVQAVIATYDTICAYTTSEKIDPKYFEKTLKNFMLNAKHSVTVNIYKDEKQFLKRVDHLNSDQNVSLQEQKEKMGLINESMKVMCL